MTRYGWILVALGLMGVLSFGAHALFSDMLQLEWEIAGGVGLAVLLAGLYLDRQSLISWGNARGTRFTAVSVALVGVAAGLAVAANVLAQRYDKRFDLTSTGRFTLSEQTFAVLDKLNAEVEVHAFFTPGTMEESRFKDRIAGYADRSAKIKVSYHDPVAEPVVARQFGITSDLGTVVLVKVGEGPVEGREKQRLESAFDEEAITNALIRLTAGTVHKICFSTGHEELDPDDDAQPSGLGIAVLKMEGQNYKVDKVTLLRSGGVPADCEALVVADPQVDWLAPEREMLASYIAGGGQALVMLDPGRAPGLASDMARYNVGVGDDIVLEQNPNYQLVGGDPSYLLLDKAAFDMHPITNPIKGGVLLRFARSISVVDAEMAGLDVMVLARTSPYAWAEKDYLDQTKIGPDDGRDQIGQIPLMAVVEVRDPAVIPVGSLTLAPNAGREPAVALGGDGSTTPGTPTPVGGDTAAAPQTNPTSADGAVTGAIPPAAPPAEVPRKAGGRLVVIGDTDFAANELVDQMSNQDLFLNTLAWLVGEEDQVSIRPPAGADGAFSMSAIQTLLVGVLSLLVVPGLAVMGAVSTWRSRRSR